jgi:hypothetical protein
MTYQIGLTAAPRKLAMAEIRKFSVGLGLPFIRLVQSRLPEGCFEIALAGRGPNAPGLEDISIDEAIILLAPFAQPLEFRRRHRVIDRLAGAEAHALRRYIGAGTAGDAARNRIRRPGVSGVATVGVENLGLEIAEQRVGAILTRAVEVSWEILRKVHGARALGPCCRLELQIRLGTEELRLVSPQETGHASVTVRVAPRGRALPAMFPNHLSADADFVKHLDRQIDQNEPPDMSFFRDDIEPRAEKLTDGASQESVRDHGKHRNDAGTGAVAERRKLAQPITDGMLKVGLILLRPLARRRLDTFGAEGVLFPAVGICLLYRLRRRHDDIEQERQGQSFVCHHQKVYRPPQKLFEGIHPIGFHRAGLALIGLGNGGKEFGDIAGQSRTEAAARIFIFEKIEIMPGAGAEDGQFASRHRAIPLP